MSESLGAQVKALNDLSPSPPFSPSVSPSLQATAKTNSLSLLIITLHSEVVCVCVCVLVESTSFPAFRFGRYTFHNGAINIESYEDRYTFTAAIKLCTNSGEVTQFSGTRV